MRTRNNRQRLYGLLFSLDKNHDPPDLTDETLSWLVAKRHVRVCKQEALDSALETGKTVLDYYERQHRNAERGTRLMKEFPMFFFERNLAQKRAKKDRLREEYLLLSNAVTTDKGLIVLTMKGKRTLKRLQSGRKVRTILDLRLPSQKPIPLPRRIFNMLFSWTF